LRGISLDNALHCFQNMQVARSTAAFLRNTLAVEAIFVPSMAFVDDLAKWCLVVFLDNLPENPSRFLPKADKAGCLDVQ
jgi:hypothetical protein